MNTAEARYETALERMNAILEGFRKDQERMRGDLTSAQETLRTEMIGRETRLLVYLISVVAVAVAALGAFVAFLEFTSPGVSSYSDPITPSQSLELAPPPPPRQ